ncbi:hypothetical protein RQP54_08255 [Curvibacter sp. APW13]|uniref:hypothetical protein n=1 Tax=Curvibacter sp. APW13 TaxID=3077236 RepID=UPI0028DFAB25|nr:hypothetical protein [Curvibacter sp. APW13]MDT8990858.1 hypothetical protein [Curvibacter sp. APW13]
MDHTTALDLAVLAEYVGNDPAELQRFIRLGEQSLRQTLAPLDAALQTLDLSSLQTCGHRAKSTARHLGARVFGDQCKALECAARAGNTVQATHHGQWLLASRESLLQALEHAGRERGDSAR